MKKSILAIAAVVAGFMSASAMANPSAFRGSPVSYELGATAHKETYTEFVDGQKVMRESAPMMGVSGKVDYRLSKGSKVTVGASYATGDAKYKGSYIGGSYGDLHLGGLGRSSFSLNLGYQFMPGFADIKVNTGLGYRRLVDNLQDAGPGGYKRTNELTFASLGVERDFAMGSWTVTPGFTYNYVLSGKQTSDLPFGSLEMKQKSGSGTELSVMFAHDSGYGGKYVMGPYLRTWSIKQSEVVGGFVEPKNKTKEIGIRVAYRM